MEEGDWLRSRVCRYFINSGSTLRLAIHPPALVAQTSRVFKHTLVTDAVEFVLGADEEAILGDADGGADGLVVAGGFGAVAHVGGVEEFKLIAGGFDDEDFAPEVHAVDFAIGSGGGGLQFGTRGEFAAPDDFAGGGFDGIERARLVVVRPVAIDEHAEGLSDQARPFMLVGEQAGPVQGAGSLSSSSQASAV